VDNGIEEKESKRAGGRLSPFRPAQILPYLPTNILPPEEDLPNLDRIIVIISVNNTINPDTKTNRNNIQIRIEKV
jgi:hypothetical protein